MATPTMERQKTTGYRRVANSHTRVGYREVSTLGSAVRVPDYTRPYPERIPRPKAVPKPEAKPSVSEKERSRIYREAKKRQILRTFCQIATVFVLCSLMIYRYAMILETNDQITKLNQQVADLEYGNQFLSVKLDSALELGTLEKYATEELGMMRPDSSQVFYVDINMEDTMVAVAESGKRTLQGAPGALMHAIRVLK